MTDEDRPDGGPAPETKPVITDPYEAWLLGDDADMDASERVWRRLREVRL